MVAAVLKLENEKIASFYQKDLPAEAFVEEAFSKLVQVFMADDDLLTDIEKLYKAHIATNKTPGMDY